MASVIKFNNSCHWYGKDGSPQHDADLRVARKQFLYPSVTTIDKDTFKNDFLDKWRMEQVALAAANTFKQPHEDEEGYANRIYQESLGKVNKASEFGKAFHDAAEKYPLYPIDTGIHPWVDRFGAWHDANVGEVISNERVLLDHHLGVAGRCDCIAKGNGRFQGRIIIPDWKTQDVKKDDKGRKKPAFYDSWTRQLAFYAVSYAKEAGLYPDIPVCLSLIFDSNEPSEPFEKVWSREETIDAYLDFVAGTYLWMSKRGYWPAAKGRWYLNPTIPIPK